MKYSALITDVDNTLFDWVGIWHAAFSSMVEQVIDLSSLDYDALLHDIKLIHQKHGTSEYAYLLEELDSVASLPPQLRFEIIQKGNEAFSRARSRETRLYPGVYKTLQRLRSLGVRIVAYTESYGVYTAYRFKACGLDGLIDDLFSPAPHYVSTSDYAALSHSHYVDHVLNYTDTHHTPPGETKPNPHILRDIVRQLGLSIDSCVYVGDSLMKDIAMANEVGMLSAHAAYGTAQHKTEYGLLKSVTHWTDETVKRETAINSASTVTPNIELTKGFDEILPLFQ